MLTIAPVRTFRHCGDALPGAIRPASPVTLFCQMGCMGGDLPNQPTYANTTQQTLKAQIAEAPQMYSAEAQYQPLLSGLESNDTLSAMNNMLYGNANSQGTMAMDQQANTAQRTSDVNDLATLGPQANAAMLASNPQSAALLSLLNGQAQSELGAGSSLTPDEQRTMQQNARAANAARGLGGTNVSVADELMNQWNLGQQLLQQRQGFAQGVINSNQQVTGDPMLAILGRNSGAVGNSTGSTTGAGFDLFNPQAGLGLAQSNYSADATFGASQPSDLSQISGLVGGILGSGGAGGAAGGIAGMM